MTDETITTEIILKATVALKNLADLTTATSSFKTKIDLARESVASFAKETGTRFGEAKKVLSDLDKEYSGTQSSSTVFGGAGQEAWNKVGESAERNSKLVVGGVDVMRRAVSFLIGQLLFQLLVAFQNVFTAAIDGLKKLETSFYNLVDAEKAMSENGINVTFKDLEATVDRLHTKFQGMFSKTELQDVVAQIALVTKNLGLSTDQIEKIAATAAQIQLSHPDKSISEISTTLTTSDINGRLTSLAKYGVNIDEIKQKEKELAAQFGVSTKDLTEHQKAVIELEAAYESVTKGADSLSERENTLGGVQKQLSNTWQDFLVEIAKTYAPEIIQGFKVLINALQIALVIFEKLEPAIRKVVILEASFVAGFKGLGGLNPLDALKKFAKQFETAKAGYQDYLNNTVDTPTGISSETAPDNSNLIKAEQKTQEELNKIAKENTDKRLDIETNCANKREDIALNNQQKLEDIATKTAQAEADARTAYADKLNEIDTDIAQKSADAKVEEHKKEIDVEKKYQDELKKLQQKFSMDLEEALQARDAKQVLHLINQFNADKNNLLDQRKEEQTQAQEDLKVKLQDIQKEGKLKRQQALRDLNLKLRDIQIADQRERQQAAIANQRALNDAAIAYQRQLEEQRLYLQRKLRDLADAIQQEFNLTAAGQAAINNLISSSGLGTASTGTTSTTPGSIGSPIGNSSSPSSINGGLYTPPSGLAEGGTFLATRPGTLRIAENRPELISASPLGRPGSDINKLFTNASIGTGGDNSGKIEIEMTLSPDLEARVVNNTLNKHANIVAKMNRSRS